MLPSRAWPRPPRSRRPLGRTRSARAAFAVSSREQEPVRDNRRDHRVGRQPSAIHLHTRVRVEGPRRKSVHLAPGTLEIAGRRCTGGSPPLRQRANAAPRQRPCHSSEYVTGGRSFAAVSVSPPSDNRARDADTRDGQPSRTFGDVRHPSVICTQAPTTSAASGMARASAPRLACTGPEDARAGNASRATVRRS